MSATFRNLYMYRHLLSNLRRWERKQGQDLRRGVGFEKSLSNFFKVQSKGSENVLEK